MTNVRTCPKCGKKLEEGFDLCWQCASQQQASQELREVRQTKQQSVLQRKNTLRRALQQSVDLLLVGSF